MKISVSLGSCRLSFHFAFVLAMVWATRAEASSVFDDAAAWFGGAHVDTDGKAQVVNGEWRDLRHWTDAGHALNVIKPEGATTNVFAQTLDVREPMGGRTYSDTVLSFRQLRRPNADASKDDQVLTCALKLPALFAPSNAGCYSVVARFRADAVLHDQTWLISGGFSYGKRTGFMYGFKLDTPGAMTNLVPTIQVGNGSWNMVDANWQDKDKAYYRYTTNQWVDVALVFKDKGVTYYHRVEDGRLFKMTKTGLGDNATNDVSATTEWRLGAQTVSANWVTISSGVNHQKSFIGSIQHFACWPRALSATEVAEAMAYPGSDRWRLGVADGGNDEFGIDGAEDGVTIDDAANPLAPWRTFRSELTAAQPSTTITFSTPVAETKLAQILRVKGTAASGAATLQVLLDGADRGTISCPADGWGSLAIRGRRLTEGAHTLVLTRQGPFDGTFAIDAVAFGGSWSLGRANHVHSQLASETTADADGYLPSRDLKSYRGVVKPTYSNTTVHVWVPAELAGKYDLKFTVADCYSSGDDIPTPRPVVQLAHNGKVLLDCIDEQKSVWYDRQAVIPAEDVTTGENTFRVTRKPGISGGWNYLDHIGCELLPPPSGSLLLLR